MSHVLLIPLCSACAGLCWWSLLQWKLPSCTARTEETAEEVVTDLGFSKALRSGGHSSPCTRIIVKDLACTQVAPKIIRPVH